jgi:hypothetical protein
MIKTTLATAAMLLLSALPASASSADPDPIRTKCIRSGTAQKCNIRVPSGFSYMALDYFHGGESFALEEFMTFEKRTYGQPEFYSERISAGVELTCLVKGNRYFCDMEFARSVTDINVTVYQSGENWGGVKWNDM